MNPVPLEADSCAIMNIEESDGESFYYKKAVKGEFNNSLYAFWRENYISFEIAGLNFKG